MRLLETVCAAGTLALIPAFAPSLSGGEPNLVLVHGSVRPRPNTVFIREGRTTRDQVLKSLEAFDTGASTAEFFWARWLEYRNPPGRRETGKVKNFVVEFDANGVATRATLCEDGDLLDVLRVSAFDAPAPPGPLSLTAWYWDTLGYLKGRPHRGTLSIDTTGLRFLGATRQSPSFGAALGEVARVAAEESTRDDWIQVSLYFRNSAVPVKRIKVELSPIGTVWLLGLLNRKSMDGLTP